MWVLCSTYPWFSSVALIQSRNDCETELVNLDTISRICIMPDYGKNGYTSNDKILCYGVIAISNRMIGLGAYLSLDEARDALMSLTEALEQGIPAFRMPTSTVEGKKV